MKAKTKSKKVASEIVLEQQYGQDLASGIHLEIPPIKKCHEQSILFMTLDTPGQ